LSLSVVYILNFKILKIIFFRDWLCLYLQIKHIIRGGEDTYSVGPVITSKSSGI